MAFHTLSNNALLTKGRKLEGMSQNSGILVRLTEGRDIAMALFEFMIRGGGDGRVGLIIRSKPKWLAIGIFIAHFDEFCGGAEFSIRYADQNHFILHFNR